MQHSIRTYHARKGRLSDQAEAILQRLLPVYGISVDGPTLDPSGIFDHQLQVVVEFGSGMGEATLAMAAARPDIGIIAVEVHTPGVARLLGQVEQSGLHNVRVVHGDGIAWMRGRIPPESLDGFRAYFPDPWPKAKHQKRRLIRPGLVAMIAQRLRVGAALHVATDWQEYGEQMVQVLVAERMLQVVQDSTASVIAERPGGRIITRFERKGLQKGHLVRDLVATRSEQSPTT